jgi:TonB family protein
MKLNMVPAALVFAFAAGCAQKPTEFPNADQMKAQDIGDTVKHHIPEVKACYDEVLRKNAKLTGKVVLQWDIDENGNAVGAKVKSSDIKDSTLQKCLLRHLKTWHFSKAPKGVIGRVVYPFVFTAE